MDCPSYDTPSSPATTGNKHSTLRPDSELFTRHVDSVLCCSYDYNTGLVASGGIDETAYVWDHNTKHVVFECKGHKDSVVATAFSFNSTYVATGDMSGYIQVRNTTTGIKVFDFELDEINWIIWHNKSDYVLLAGTIKGDFWMWNVNDPSAVKTFASYSSSTTVARLLTDGIRLIVGYGDGYVRMFDLKTARLIHDNHEITNDEVICMDVNSRESVIAVGYGDSSVCLMTAGSMKVIGKMKCPTPEEFRSKQHSSEDVEPDISDDDMKDDSEKEKERLKEEKSGQLEVIDEYSSSNEPGQSQDDGDLESEESESSEDEIKYSVESVLFSPCDTFLAVANNSGTIIFYDVSTQAIRCQLHTGIGLSKAAWTPNGCYVTGNLDGTIRIYDKCLVERDRIAAHQDQILDLQLKYGVLVTASEDKTSRVIKF